MHEAQQSSRPIGLGTVLDTPLGFLSDGVHEP